jgi:hypothetical protein
LADHVDVPVAVPLPPRSLTHVTDETPTLSLAVPPTVRVDAVVAKLAAVVGDVMAMAGAVESGGAGTVNAPVELHAVAPVDVIVCTCQVAAPDASVMPGASVHVPPLPHPAPAAVVVEEMTTACVLSVTSSLYDAAPATPVHENAGVRVVIEPSGESNVTGFAVTPPTVHVNVREADKTPSNTVAVTVDVPVAVGVPVIAPLVVLMIRPAGRPVALKLTG